MDNLVGKKFVIDQMDYSIVDMRDVDGVVMVYAEPVDGAKGPGRAAFRLEDIDSEFESAEVA